MFTSNPFAALSASIAPAVMQTYIVVMITLVAAGTLFDVVHKGSAKYFFQNMRKAKGAQPEQPPAGWRPAIWLVGHTRCLYPEAIIMGIPA